jgi:dTDP-4-amino-4,6-dideoxygalactose transaminase
MSYRILLSPPHVTAVDERMLMNAFRSGWIAPVGPSLAEFEKDFALYTRSSAAVAVSSGTAALHLAAVLAGVGEGDEILVADTTFIATITGAVHRGARPVFIDVDPETWTMDPYHMENALRERRGRPPKAIFVVHMYGQMAKMDTIMEIADHYGVPVIEDAAQAVGSTFRGTRPGEWGMSAAFSFNGNKIMTTSGGGMLTSMDSELIARARKLSTQAREPVEHYWHAEPGYNYRMSNLLAGLGCAQLAQIEDRVMKRRLNFHSYAHNLGALPGISFQRERWGRSNRWMSAILVEPDEFGMNREELRVFLAARGIESRAVWTPLHTQPCFEGLPYYGDGVSLELFSKGLCLPSGSSLTPEQRAEVCQVVCDAYISTRRKAA